ncbi:MAG: ribose-phosphate pyrophosphokinase [Deltaproteobacteria bacterium]|nr:ribose-phosphate pyrophosphokinase [Deltaproteobacteria bacterium]MDZ4224818.1 ribose-phosphate pyrophosphokinase [bacterium]
MYSYKNIKIFSGNSNPELAKSIVDFLELPMGDALVTRFSDGEVWVEIKENVRGMDTFVIQPTSQPANENLMELLVMIDALKRSSADRITAVLPYYGYARQDRKVAPRTPISAKLVADLLTAAGADRVLSLDMHAGQIQGFFNIPVDNLFAMPVFLKYLQDNLQDDMVVIAPDAGAAERSRAYAKRLSCPLAMIDKRRTRPNVSEVMNVIGDVSGKRAIIIDDIVDTAGTITQAVEALLKNGAKEVYGVCTHAVLSGPALERISKSNIKKLVTTDSIRPASEAKKCSKIEVLSVANLLGEAIRRIYHADSVSSLFI